MKLFAQFAIVLIVMAALLTGRPSQQSPTGSIQGIVLRAGTQDPVPNTTLTITTAQAAQAYDVMVKAGEGIVLQGVRQALPELITMSAEDFKEASASVRGLPLPPAFVAAFNQLEAVRAGNPNFPKTVLSDSTGHFTITELPPGNYAVTAQHEGYFGKPDAGSNDLRLFETVLVNVTAQQTRDVMITLSAGAVISGHVFDDAGQPVSGINVQAITISYQNGVPGLQGEITNPTDDRGAYRLYFLPPGEYYVGANPRPIGSPAVPNANGEVVVRTFHPNSASVLSSTLVPVRLGDEAAGIDIHMRTVQTVKIRGTVVNQLGDPLSNPDGSPGRFSDATLLILQRDNSIPEDAGSRNVGSVSMANKIGSFTITGILPGNYDLYARMNDPRGSVGQGGASNAWGRTVIEVRDKDLEGVIINVHPSVNVNGTLVINGVLPAAPNNPIRVGLQPDGSSTRFPNYQGILGRAQPPGANGGFTIPGVAEGAYRIQVLNLPVNAYVEEVRQGGRPVYDSGFYVENKTPDAIEVVVNANGGSIEGNVTTLERKPSVASTVVLIPDPPHRENTGLFKTFTTDAQGHFVMRGIRPGAYRLLAWEVVPPGAYLNPSFLAKYEDRAVLVNVGQQSSNPVELTVIPRN